MKIKINYKSGHSHVLDVKDYKVSWDRLSGSLTELIVTGCKHKFIFVGLINVESIWRIE